ncbi:MAG: DUF484 family protein [Minwuia sp.]|uniref:DUF484 family protein n=1 Tax=Minwuia sp. TaxID=2493630 RepID=UPI003A869D91
MAGRDSAATGGGDSLTEAEIVAFLLQHPDFLNRHPELLRRLTPPSRFEAESEGAEVVDMQGFMVTRLQADLDRIRDSQDELIQSARSNLSSQKQIHEAALAVLDARDLEELIHIVTRDLPLALDVDAISICVERETEHPGESRVGGMFVLLPGDIDAALGGERRVLLRERAEGTDAFFGPAAALVRSDALVRLELTGTAPAAMLALGSREIGRFHPGQGTELLSFMSEVVARCLRRWLDLPPA